MFLKFSKLMLQNSQKCFEIFKNDVLKIRDIIFQIKKRKASRYRYILQLYVH